MSSIKVNFKNSKGEKLAARLELPDRQEAHNYAIFAHCFTCNKNLTAVRNISRALNDAGIAVLRFDFTGLGESEGEFAETNFSSNVSDLVCAAGFLAENYQAPSLLIGHSLGGAAVIFATGKIDSVKALATVGAPASPAHVSHLFSGGLEEIRTMGEAKVNIGGRPFTVKKDFIDDIESVDLKETLQRLRKPILVAHSPQDMTVEVENAKQIYHHAHHPKSFISLDGADHLLTNSKDSTYLGNVISGWVERYLDVPELDTTRTKHQVAVAIGNDNYTCQITAGKHTLTGDEPADIGGRDYGPAPYEFVSAGLGSCTVITLRMYADRKEWKLDKIICHVNHEKRDKADGSGKEDVFTRELEFYGELEEKNIARLLQIADKCPVHKTLHASSVIETSLLNS
ncbi:MAG: alpha/beta fold hydrolase, partial [Flavobacteriales bacterium]